MPAVHESARLVARLCTLTVLAAVAANFLLAGRRRAIQTRRDSAVKTGSMLAFLLAIYALIRMRLGAYDLPALYPPAAAAGMALLVLGAVVNVLGRLALGRNWGNQVLIYKDHTLVTGGVYRLVRHPLYAGLIWMFIGAALAFQNWAALLATLFLFMPAMYYRGKQEEKALLAEFPGYGEYQDNTGMFFPIPMGPEAARVPRPAFAFCRISVTVLLWAALGLHSVGLVIAVFFVLALSALLKVQRSPMIQLYQRTILRLFPTRDYEFLDVPAMRFAHGAGALMALAAIAAIRIAPQAGWYGLAAFCLLKTVSAFGFCPASKLFGCLREGGCCALTKSAQSRRAG